jgi:hypothetical protein
MQTSTPFHAPRTVVLLFLGLAILGGGSLAAGLFLEPEQAWANILLLSNYLAGLSLGGLVLVSLSYVTGARWSVPLRRLPEALAVALPVATVGLVLVLVLRPSLYSWSISLPAEEENASALRALWLDPPFFLIRALVYLAIWLTFAVAIVWTSRRQDQTGDPALTRRNVRLSAAFLVAFGVTCWLASADWLMSLEPDWSSTVFGVYNFAGLFVSALAAVTLLAICLRRHSALQSYVTKDHLHDLGTLLFSFSSFWMYTWFCQYMLIWYTNHPDETTYFRRRWDGAWPDLLLLDLVLNWGIPFLVLLFRAAKRSPLILAAMCILILVGRWIDLFLMIFPSQPEELAIPGVPELVFGLGAAGIFMLVVLYILGKAPLVPINDPMLSGGELKQGIQEKLEKMSVS